MRWIDVSVWNFKSIVDVKIHSIAVCKYLFEYQKLLYIKMRVTSNLTELKISYAQSVSLNNYVDFLHVASS